MDKIKAKTKTNPTNARTTTIGSTSNMSLILCFVFDKMSFVSDEITGTKNVSIAIVNKTENWVSYFILVFIMGQAILWVVPSLTPPSSQNNLENMGFGRGGGWYE